MTRTATHVELSVLRTEGDLLRAEVERVTAERDALLATAELVARDLRAEIGYLLAERNEARAECIERAALELNHEGMIERLTAERDALIDVARAADTVASEGVRFSLGELIEGWHVQSDDMCDLLLALAALPAATRAKIEGEGDA